MPSIFGDSTTETLAIYDPAGLHRGFFHNAVVSYTCNILLQSLVQWLVQTHNTCYCSTMHTDVKYTLQGSANRGRILLGDGSRRHDGVTSNRALTPYVRHEVY